MDVVLHVIVKNIKFKGRNYDLQFQYCLQIRYFAVISSYHEANLSICMLKVGNENTRNRIVKLKNKFTRKTLPNGAMLSLLLILNVFLTYL